MRIYVTTIHHKNGIDTWVRSTAKTAKAVVAKFCRYWWNDHITAEDAPKDDDLVIKRYFGLVGDFESYEINSHNFKVPQKKISTIQKKFLKAGGEACPYCGEEVSISGEEVEICFGAAVQEVSCNECGRSWRAIYKLHEFVEIK